MTASAQEAPSRLDGLAGVIVYAADAAYLSESRALAEKLGVALARYEDEARRARLALRLDGEGLALVGSGMQLRGDFGRMRARLKPGRLNAELLVRAAKVKGGPAGLLAVDATAGLGEDSLLLAAMGYDVVLFERNPVIAALLRDALRRAGDDAELSSIVGRMRVFERDSAEALSCLEETPAVVLLDPMFPDRRKSSAVKKKLQLLQQLERPCEDERVLLDAALAARPRKVVIKRPAKGPYLAGRKPDYSLAGKAIRFDCIAG